MRWASKLHSALITGWACLLLLVPILSFADTVPNDPVQLLKHADEIKSANHDEFAKSLERLDRVSDQLTPEQRYLLGYLRGWQNTYFGNYDAAIKQLDAVITNSRDATLRFRAGLTIVNALEIALRNQEAYERLSQLLDLLPQISDQSVRLQGYGVAAQLYNQAGQYDLALNYSEKLIAANDDDIVCKGRELRIETLYRSDKLQSPSAEIDDSIAACAKVNEPIFAAQIRIDAAKVATAAGRPHDAIVLLQHRYDETQRTRYPFIIASMNTALAQAYWKMGDNLHAQQFAKLAIDTATKNTYTEPIVGAYEVLYQVAQKAGDYPTAFDYLQKYAAASKGYLNDTSARALAYQMVNQQVQQKKQQVDVLNNENQMLHLTQQVSVKNAEAGKLLLLLLLTVLGSIALYAYRTKRAQLKFMNLARRDGLTGIFNRQHFIEASEDILSYAAKSVRDAALIAIDLDHFKDINDNHGHAAGDRVLKAAVTACQSQLRLLDVFGRLGGEEFGILLLDCVPERAADIAEQMRSAVAALGDENGSGFDFPVFASFGVAATRWSGYDLRQLLAHADSALYRAKREGRNRVAVHDDLSETAEMLPSGALDRRRG